MRLDIIKKTNQSDLLSAISFFIEVYHKYTKEDAKWDKILHFDCKMEILE